MSSLRILISGAGVGGPAAAFWLSRLGHSCTIIERFPSLRSGGLQIDLRKQGIEMAERMGIIDQVRRHNVDEAGVQIVDSNGKQQLMMARQEQGAGGQKFTSEIEIMRGDLGRTLYDATKGAAMYRFGVWVEEWEDVGDEVQVKFSDGSVERFDLLVAADGQNSRIRSKMMQQAGIEDQSRMLGVYQCYFKVPRQPSDGNLATGYHAPGRRFMMTRWGSPDSGQAYLTTMACGEEMKAALKPGATAAQQKQAFARVFAGAGWQTPRLLEAMQDAGHDFYAQEVLQRKSSAWSSGRVVLLGDAGYCPSPLTGMGTSLALVAGYVLAGELSRHAGHVPAALKAYEATLRPFVEETQELPPGMPGLLLPETGWGIWTIHTVVWLVVKLGLDRMMEYFEKREEDEWRVPEYEGLK